MLSSSTLTKNGLSVDDLLQPALIPALVTPPAGRTLKREVPLQSPADALRLVPHASSPNKYGSHDFGSIKARNSGDVWVSANICWGFFGRCL